MENAFLILRKQNIFAKTRTGSNNAKGFGKNSKRRNSAAFKSRARKVFWWAQAVLGPDRLLRRPILQLVSSTALRRRGANFCGWKKKFRQSRFQKQDDAFRKSGRDELSEDDSIALTRRMRTRIDYEPFAQFFDCVIVVFLFLRNALVL